MQRSLCLKRDCNVSHSRIPEQEVARYWDENANVWADHVRQGWDAYREYFNNPAFFEFMGDLNGKTVLDAGCGEGYNTRLLARSGARMTGVDISEKMIELARQEERREPLGIRYEVASFCDLSLFDDASFRCGGFLHGAHGWSGLRRRCHGDFQSASARRRVDVQHNPPVLYDQRVRMDS
jgi:SAM-dependent methyltransferase